MLGGAQEELARLVPELGLRDAAGRAGQLEPSRLFELLLGMLHRIAERAAVLLVVEDLHWPTSRPAICSASWSATSARAWRWC